MSAKIYVEGGSGKALNAKCREAFKSFFEAAGLRGRLPRVVPGGGRQQTYDDFCTALSSPHDDAFIVLLVDSEGPVAEGAGPWTHLRNRQGDGWDRPEGATDDQAHLMVQCMEGWFLADREALRAVFGTDFRPAALPQRAEIEQIAKQDVFAGLANATRDCGGRRGYRKGRDSFDVVAALDPAKVTAASPHAKRLVDVLLANLQPPRARRAR